MTKNKPKGKGTAPDRFRILNAFVDFSLRELTRNEIAVWMVLFRDTRKGTATVSQKFIAERCGISERTVRRMVLQLVNAGLLVVVRRGGIAVGASTYKVIPVTKTNFERRSKRWSIKEDNQLSG
ncbi:helix-turn-helix domain-containing protein [Aureliella helgolandensis]|uniref:MarR family protein n=1 Tax=Aureliella helgolandensis TaxID=2527968 RepID=A0A518G9S0_9BACT|nr:helix-turn-helix domain-containing protein [Aureliella helgolandensis]QDV25336.1 hypothetical protein Q31a_36600 [Aureliella helgolandensis]